MSELGQHDHVSKSESDPIPILLTPYRSLVELQRVDGPVSLLESSRLVGDIIVAGSIACRGSALLVPDSLVDVASAECRVENLQWSA